MDAQTRDVVSIPIGCPWRRGDQHVQDQNVDGTLKELRSDWHWRHCLTWKTPGQLVTVLSSVGGPSNVAQGVAR
jgi:hypothetical protein